MMAKADYLPKNLTWLNAYCPICSKEYWYFSGEKPKTCGRLNCLYQIAVAKQSKKEKL